MIKVIDQFKSLLVAIKSNDIYSIIYEEEILVMMLSITFPRPIKLDPVTRNKQSVSLRNDDVRVSCKRAILANLYYSLTFEIKFNLSVNEIEELIEDLTLSDEVFAMIKACALHDNEYSYHNFELRYVDNHYLLHDSIAGILYVIDKPEDFSYSELRNYPSYSEHSLFFNWNYYGYGYYDHHDFVRVGIRKDQFVTKTYPNHHIYLDDKRYNYLCSYDDKDYYYDLIDDRYYCLKNNDLNDLEYDDKVYLIFKVTSYIGFGIDNLTTANEHILNILVPYTNYYYQRYLANRHNCHRFDALINFLNDLHNLYPYDFIVMYQLYIKADDTYLSLFNKLVVNLYHDKDLEWREVYEMILN